LFLFFPYLFYLFFVPLKGFGFEAELGLYLILVRVFIFYFFFPFFRLTAFVWMVSYKEEILCIVLLQGILSLNLQFLQILCHSSVIFVIYIV
jgi:hypothetical protein